MFFNKLKSKVADHTTQLNLLRRELEREVKKTEHLKKQIMQMECQHHPDDTEFVELKGGAPGRSISASCKHFSRCKACNKMLHDYRYDWAEWQLDKQKHENRKAIDSLKGQGYKVTAPKEKKS